MAIRTHCAAITSSDPLLLSQVTSGLPATTVPHRYDKHPQHGGASERHAMTTTPTSDSNNYGEHTEAKISEVIANAKRYGESSIVALAGVPGTGKSFVGRIVTQRLAGAPERVLELQLPATTARPFGRSWGRVGLDPQDFA